MPESFPDDSIAPLIEKAANADRYKPPDKYASQEQQQLFGDDKRDDRFKSCIHWLTICGVWIIGTAIVVVLVARIVHLVLPPSRQWMSAEQERSLDHFLFSGTIGGVLTKGVQQLQSKNTSRKKPNRKK